MTVLYTAAGVSRAYRAVEPVPGRLVSDVHHLLLHCAAAATAAAAAAGRLVVQPAVLGVGRVDELLQVLRLPLPLPLPGLDLPQLGQQVLLLLDLTGHRSQVRSGAALPQSDRSQVRRCSY